VRSAVLMLLIAGCYSSVKGAAINDLKHRYSFTDNTEDSIGSADLALLGTASVGGGVLDLPGGSWQTNNAYAELASVTELAGTIHSAGAITMEMWFHQDNSTPDAKLMMTGASGSEFMAMIPERVAGGFFPNEQAGSINDGSGENFVAASSGSLANDEDFYMAVVWDDAHELRIYFGEQGTTLADAAQGMTQQLSEVEISEFYLGSAVTGFGNNDFDGQIDEFRIWATALSVDDIEENFANGPDGLATPPPNVQVPEPASIVTWALLGLALFGYRVNRRLDW
jgi:hypothetical protein